MPLSNKGFSGKLNLDAQAYRVPPEDYIDALNITRDASGDGQDQVVSNVPGNKFIPYNLPNGVNKVIGQYPDKVRNRVYYWIWNSLGYHTWCFYNRNTEVITKLIEDLTDTNNIAVLDLNPSKKILHVDIIYRDLEGDLIFFTDGNTTPKEANVQYLIDGHYSTIISAFIEMAKRPPLAPPTSVYGSDTTRTANALRRKLFMPAVRWQYDDYSKSSVSPYGKIPLPIGYYGSDNDIANGLNNFITITVPTGDKNVTDIEILVRQNLGDGWADFLLIAKLNKVDLNIPNNDNYDFLFYNDALYPPISDGVEYVDGVQVIPLFFWVPQLADTQALGNGNIPIYAAITEGYNAYPVNQLDVSITAANKTNIPPDATPPAITYENIGASFTFTVNGSVPVGTNYKIYIFFNGTPPSQTYGVRLVGNYTSVLGNTKDDVAFALYNQFNSYSSTPVITGSYGGGNTWQSNFGTTGSYVFSVQVIAGSADPTQISTEKTWMWDANYIFGLVYVDEQGRDMPGVITFANPIDSDNDFVVTTPSLSLNGTALQTPVISASINHLPPAGAKKFHWVRRRQTYGTFLMYMTCDYQTAGDYLYFCLANIDQYKLDNTQFIYGTAPITDDTRIRILAGVTATAYNGTLYTEDYQILGSELRLLTAGNPAIDSDKRSFIKVKKPDGALPTAYSQNMLVMVYTPTINPSSIADAVYWEWGESFDLYELNGVMYHRGGDQNQTASQPATFSWEEGDVYFHERLMYNSIVAPAPFTGVELSIMDANFSDFFDSAVNDNGRAQAIEANAKRTFNPTLIRFGGAYQFGTNVSEVNAFFFENFDEYDRSNGIIRKLFIEGRRLHVFQQFDVGIVPIYTQIILDTAGNPLEANSTQLLNKITYPFVGKFGIGDIPESFAYGKGSMYFGDSNKAVYCRLSNDGITPLSILYQCNAFFVEKLKAYNNSLNNGYAASGQVYAGNPTVYGVFNEYTNRAIIAFEEINRYDVDGNLTYHQDAYTLTFNEARNASEGFESFQSYMPEMMSSLNNLFITFKQGRFWKHEDAPYCNFFGVQYNVYIKAAFNDNNLFKKTWQTISEYGSQIWDCTEISSQMLNQSGTPQTSNLNSLDFRVLETNFHAAILRDTNYGSDKYNGKVMRGNYLIVKFEILNASNFVFLNIVSIKWNNAPLTVTR